MRFRALFGDMVEHPVDAVLIRQHAVILAPERLLQLERYRSADFQPMEEFVHSSFVVAVDDKANIEA